MLFDSRSLFRFYTQRILGALILPLGIVGALFFSCSACGEKLDPISPDYTTSQGINVYDPERLSRQPDVERMISDVLRVAGADSDSLSGWAVHLSSEMVQRNGRHLAGLTLPETEECFVQYPAPGTCPARSAFSHELTHAIQWVQAGVSDLKHEDRHYWLYSCTSVAPRAAYDSILALCPEIEPTIVCP